MTPEEYFEKYEISACDVFLPLKGYKVAKKRQAVHILKHGEPDYYLQREIDTYETNCPELAGKVD